MIIIIKMSLLSRLLPTSFPHDPTSLAFRSLLALEFLAGSLFIIKTVLFTRSLSQRYSLQALGH